MGRTREMSARHVRAFVDGGFLLHHLAEVFRGLAVAVRCRHCGQIPVARVQPDRAQVDITCGGRHGAGRGERALGVAALLLTLGWDLACPDCGVSLVGDNAPHATRVTVTCSCTTRTYDAGGPH